MGAAGVHNMDAFIALSAQVTSLTNMVKAMTNAPATVQQVADVSCVYCRERHLFDNCPRLIIMWVIMINKIRAIITQTTIITDEGNTQISHGAT